MDTKAKIVIALVAVLILGELAYVFLLAPQGSSGINFPGKITQQTLQVPYRVVSHGDKIIFKGTYQPWMQAYIKNYYTENNTTLVIINHNITAFYKELKERGLSPLILTYLVDINGLNHSYAAYLPYVPVNRTIVLQGVYVLQNGQVLQTSTLQPVINRETVTLPYKLKKIIKTLYHYTWSFENRSKSPKPNNICYNISSSVKQPYVTYLGTDYIIVNESFNNISQILKDYPGAICPPTEVTSEEPLNISADNVSLAYVVLLTPLEPAYPEITKTITDLNETAFNITLELSKSGDAIINYIIIK